LNKQLKVRTNALPTLKNKESALRVEVKNAKVKSRKLLDELDKALKSYDYLAALWNEFEPGLISVKDVKLKTEKVAGIKTPGLEKVEYDVKSLICSRSPFGILTAWTFCRILHRLALSLRYTRRK